MGVFILFFFMMRRKGGKPFSRPPLGQDGSIVQILQPVCLKQLYNKNVIINITVLSDTSLSYPKNYCFSFATSSLNFSQMDEVG